MEELEKILIEHTAQYPELQPQDAVKLIYQNEFGGGHIISDAFASLEYLTEEVSDVDPDETAPIIEDIGNGLCRLNLRVIKDSGYSLSLINRLFVASANGVRGVISSFEHKLDILRTLTINGLMPFSAQSLQNYLDVHQKDNYPIVRHSDLFRETYHPAYRVVLTRYVKYIQLFSTIDRLISDKQAVVVAIDGRCGSGKTTLARLTADIFDCNVIDMDDFFLPLALRTDARLDEPGGNIHYERFLDEVITGLRSGIPFQYRVFSCLKMGYEDSAQTIIPKPLTIVEGSYSLHPLWASIYDLRVFTTCSPQEQRRRVLERNGPALLERFQNEWIPMENRYFEKYGIPESCDLVFFSGQPL